MGQSSSLRAETFRNDPRVQQAKELLLAALADAQQGITATRRPVDALSARYASELEKLASVRGAKTYFPYLASGIGNGPWVELADGSIKLDFITGIGVHGMGHSHPELLISGVDAALQDTVMQGNLQQHGPTVEVSQQLLNLANKNKHCVDNCLLTTSGAMANENALKIAFHNRAPADRVIAIDNCFAGRSIAMAQLTDRPHYRTGVPTALAVDYIPPADPDLSAESIDRSLEALDKHLRRYPGKHAALWLELVAGEGGYYPGSTEYFAKLIERAKQAGVLVIFDEVQTFSRLTEPFAMQHFEIETHADIVTIGKVSQLCATLYRSDLHPKGPLLSQTFTAASSAIEAAIVLLGHLASGECYGPSGSNTVLHDYFADKLQKLSEAYPTKISGPYGCGMMVAFTPGDGSAECARAMVHALYEEGLMGFVAGGNPARIRFLPPLLATTKEHIDVASEILGRVISKT